MSKSIPLEMREQLADDPFMQRCIIADDFLDYCEGRIEWNHAFSYGGRRQNELWALIPMCKRHQDKEAALRFFINMVMRERILHFNAEADFRAKYPKSTLL